ncbi:prolyl oligopeptidase family serine peptidase [Runella sp. CRIBMP]|uniref:alpha/beta hydrolase n=1 Tax=Runella sp. CRIBMP TaxID=2683261 RepID=UPI00141201C8|nr:alpha/beta hydrolase [Runella sp. CRIBMP]NBB21228.1 prolyl oligopeptidase family serine peptidase [Runella sp. CRIBMP]
MNIITKINVTVFGILSTLSCLAQQEIALYPSTVPNAKDVVNEEVKTASNVVSKVSQPTLTVFLPPKNKATGAAVIICPGGGYGVLVIKREGYDVAEAFTKQGIAAFVLKYRLPSEKTMIDPSIGPLQDAQQAIKTIRLRAAEWNVAPTKIGIMGFSAGGHLAATAGTHFEKPALPMTDGISVRPDFMILVYPVISFMEGIGHKGSGVNLLGKNASSAQIKLFSNELQVTSSTPPAFITHASDDTVVPVSNSLLFYEALQRNAVSSELHIYSKGEHGYLKVPAFDEWFGRCLHWMGTAGFVK